ncbi:PP2C family serine/threonine-protein phosphatase [Thermomonas flagellata]|uniref:PP2C family serine/threonine-protein phosphatase n=1 Tax=Thermomonas flagellata TaxID=2888524 RepID=UPI001F049759|nr:PP2C family serine/threonine-protein phosphatase [Thermomonas flagellata]
MPQSVALSAWRVCGAAVTGLAHYRAGLPCQDAVAWRNTVRPILALSDGAGSAAVSERGATELVRGMSRFLMSLEDELCAWLDDASGDAKEQAGLWSCRLLAHARGLIEDLADADKRRIEDVRATLSLAVMGTMQVFWWQVGDGAIVAESAGGLQVLASSAKAKGEFANQTSFVDTAGPNDVQFGLLPSAEIHGLALMSDGGAERLVAHDGSRVAARMGTWFGELARQSLGPDRIAAAYHEPAMWERTTLDDRSIVLAARGQEFDQPP